MIRVFQPTLGQAELAAIADVFEDQWPGVGPRAEQFQNAFADYVSVDSDEVLAVTSCTEGLFQAVSALRLGRSDEVALPTVSFIGAAHAVRAAGAKLRLVDVDPVTLNLSTELLEAALTPKTKAVVLLHFGGRLDEIQEIAELAAKKGLFLIEDSACSLGGKKDGRAYGTHGDVGVWSFDAMKLLVTGDGGMIRVRDATLRQIISDRVKLGGTRPGLELAKTSGRSWWKVNPRRCGRKAFMNDLTAAIGLVQLQRIDGFIARRREIAKLYDDSLNDLAWMRLPPAGTDESVPYFYWIQTAAATRDEFAYYLRERDIYTTFRYWPLHRTSLYWDDPERYPGAEAASSTTLLLPLHQNLSDRQVLQIVDAIRQFQERKTSQ